MARRDQAREMGLEYRLLYANRCDAGTGTWAAGGTLLETSDEAADYPELAADLDGNALVVWTQSDGVNVDVFVNRYDAAGGAFLGADAIGLPSGDVEHPRAAFDEAGYAIVTWVQPVGGVNSVLARRYDVAADAWGNAAELLELGDELAEDPVIDLDPEGNAIVVWSQKASASEILYASRYTASTGTWGEPRRVEDGLGSMAVGHVALDPAGNGFAVWTQFDLASIGVLVNRFE